MYSLYIADAKLLKLNQPFPKFNPATRMPEPNPIIKIALIMLNLICIRKYNNY